MKRLTSPLLEKALARMKAMKDRRAAMRARTSRTPAREGGEPVPEIEARERETK
ncbi:MAG: hypothetical protein H6873_05505 [Hyphomicrobiaceae bacterium]|nr:hypothetical protein [Hyphomicrobiaceae bacterium]